MNQIPHRLRPISQAGACLIVSNTDEGKFRLALLQVRRHPRAGGDPRNSPHLRGPVSWVPACAGMTLEKDEGSITSAQRYNIGCQRRIARRDPATSSALPRTW